MFYPKTPPLDLITRCDPDGAMSYGKSLSLTKNAFLEPPSEDSDDVSRHLSGRRQANVYDAVAGTSYNKFWFKNEKVEAYPIS